MVVIWENEEIYILHGLTLVQKRKKKLDMKCNYFADIIRLYWKNLVIEIQVK